MNLYKSSVDTVTHAIGYVKSAISKLKSYVVNASSTQDRRAKKDGGFFSYFKNPLGLFGKKEVVKKNEQPTPYVKGQNRRRSNRGRNKPVPVVATPVTTPVSVQKKPSVFPSFSNSFSGVFFRKPVVATTPVAKSVTYVKGQNRKKNKK